MLGTRQWSSYSCEGTQQSNIKPTSTVRTVVVTTERAMTKAARAATVAGATRTTATTATTMAAATTATAATIIPKMQQTQQSNIKPTSMVRTMVVTTARAMTAATMMPNGDKHNNQILS